ncbi:MAG: AI-2E family transporter [Acidobacteria bacterium]|nr:AI-2E family transporter [Acidobacteriota bacterium]
MDRILNIKTERQSSRRGDIVFTFALALLLCLAWFVRDVLVLIYVSALFAVVLTPVLNGIMSLRIREWHPGKGLAVLILLLAVAGAVTLFIAFALPPVIRDLKEFGSELPTRGPKMLDRIHRLPFMRHVDVSSLNTKLQDFASNFATYVFVSIKGWAGKVADIVTGIVLTVYFMLEGDTAYRWILSFFPVQHRQRLDQTLGRAELRMGKWLLGQGSLMLILGITSTIVFVALKIRYAYALGVLMGVFNIIPVAGALISVSLALLVAAIDSWGHVLGIIIFYAIYAQIETSFLTPRIMQSSVDLAGLAVVISLLLGASMAGVVGAMVAVPTAVLVAVLLNEYGVQEEPIIDVRTTE